MKPSCSAALMSFADDGAELFRGAAIRVLGEREAALASVAPDRAGVRLQGVSGGAIGAISVAALGAASRAVRAILFDKNEEMN